MQPSLFGDSQYGATFSQCRKYRYALWRIWDENLPRVMFIGLNPSSANETEPDPTIRRVVRFALDWGFGGVYMMNCFPLVSTDPDILKEFYTTAFHSSEDFENARMLLETSRKCSEIIFAWGNFKEAVDRGKALAGYFKEAKALHLNKNGSPMHPLYVPANIKPIKYQL